jgi:superfamily II RNA helicase
MTLKPRGKASRFVPKRRRAPAQPIHLKPGADPAVRQALKSIGVPKSVPFSPDPFQSEAVAAIQEVDCLVTAPTGSGKTWIAVQAISRVRAAGGRSWYATPLKALSNAKFNEFSEIFGQDQVGILTGDRKERPEASVIVGTTEILRNQLYDAMYQGETLDTDLVVLDEAHFLGDPDRGVVWEETMIYLPSRIPLLLLSATIGNAAQIAEWLCAIRSRECRVIEATQRPVPLYPVFFHPSGTLLPLLSGSDPGKNRMSPKVREYIRNEKSQRWAIAPGQLPPLGEVLRVLHHFDLLPAIFFLKSRADCDHALELCRESPVGGDPVQKEALYQRISEIISQSPHLKHHRQLWHLKHLALGAHHSGQLPAWKQVIETLMTEGLLQAVFATSTVAAGVNFPARTVVFLNTDRFNGVEFMPLSPTEFHQMTGRAGRRGMDKIGFAAAIPGKYLDIPLCARLVASPPSDVLSQLRINFSMVLNLLLSHPPDQIENLLMRSFATFSLMRQSDGQSGSQKLSGARHRVLIQEFNRHLEFLKQTRFVAEDGALTRDGLWASQLRVDQPLLIAEGFRKRAFPESSPALMAAVMSLFVSDREYDDPLDRHMVPQELLDAVAVVRSVLKPLMRDMYDQDFNVRPLYLKPAIAVYAWASGRTWQDVTALSEGAEGDLVMLMLRTADHLRHVVSLTKTFPEAAQTAAEAIGLLLKEPVMLEIA